MPQKKYPRPSCIDCGKELKMLTSIRCMSCAAKASHPRKKPLVKYCLGCGKEGKDKNGHHGQRGLCRKCAAPEIGMKRRRRITLLCPQCQVTFETQPNIAKKNEKTFCSKKCYDEWKSENLTGDKVHNWKGGPINYYGPNWRQQGRLARSRANNQCEYCSKVTKGRSLDVHHIKSFRSFGYIKGQNNNYLLANNLDNLIALCLNCHRKAETGRIIIKSRSDISERPIVSVRFYQV